MRKNLIQPFVNAIPFILAALLCGCGSGSSTVNGVNTKVTPTIASARVIAFGDAVSDVGQNGARYTVNDAAVNGSMTLTERIAADFGFSTIAPVNSGVLAGGAYSYAKGGATIAAVGQQIDAFVAAGNQLTDNDLVVVTAGTQDIIDNATAYYAQTITADQAKANIASAVGALVVKIQKLTNEAGAKHVLVVTPINVARTPWGLAKGANYPSSSADYAFLETLSVATSGDATVGSFAGQLSFQIGQAFPSSSSGLKVLLADISNFSNLITGTAAGSANAYGRVFPHPTGSVNSYGLYSTALGVALTNPDVPVCSSGTPILSCNANTIAINPSNGLVWDYNSSVFADDLNLTPAANRIIADYIVNSIMRVAGWI
jgi:GDSL-like Lipase/Acylhydrolase